MMKFRKLPDGSWGVGSAIELQPGQTVDIPKRDGGSSSVTIGALVASGDGAWIYSLAPRERPAAVQVGDMAGVTALFDKARKHLRYPAVVFAIEAGYEKGDFCLIKLYPAGERARVPGSINVVSKDANEYGERTWFGRILTSGSFEASGKVSPNAIANIVPQLRAFAADPVTGAKKSALLTGRCCFCNTALRDERSTALGYGSTCAKHYGLPWDTKSARAAMSEAA